jgi:hypothetical protein
MKKKTISALIIGIVTFSMVQAQSKDYKILIMGVPQYLLLNGIRLDFDVNLNHKNKWLVFAPQLYNAKGPVLVDIGDRYYDIEQVQGLGLELNYKRFFSKRYNAQGIYLATGVVYNYFDIRSDGIIWSEVAGTNIMESQRGKVDSQIHKMGAQTMLGFQSAVFEDFFIDFYVGFGLRYSIRNEEDMKIAHLSTFSGDYGYSGTNFIGGVRFGIGF